MVRYAVKDLHALLLWMDQWIAWTYSQENFRFGDSARLTTKEKEMLANQASCIEKHTKSLELPKEAIGYIGEFRVKLQYPNENVTIGESRGYLQSMRRVLTDTLESRVFMYIPADVSKYARGYQGPTTQLPASFLSFSTIMFDSSSLAGQPFGKKVFDVFEKARFDAEQAALCIVAGAPTAAVFHMMRVVEWGVRALGAELGLRKIKEVMKPKPGGLLKAPATRLVPIENATWEKIQGQLRTKVENRLNKLRPGPAKDRKSAYYNSILEDFHGFKGAWRNHVMHSRFKCKSGEEMQVLSHVERFMKSLADGYPVTAPSA